MGQQKKGWPNRKKLPTISCEVDIMTSEEEGEFVSSSSPLHFSFCYRGKGQSEKTGEPIVKFPGVTGSL
jgi:hypothetical protein